MTRAALMIALFFLAGAVSAQGDNRHEPGASRAEVTQKAMLVRRLLAAAEPPRPADAAAGALHTRALEHLERGEYREADARLNEAIRAMQLERRQATDAQLDANTGTRYESLLSSVELMRSTYARYLGAREDMHGMLLAEVDAHVAEAWRLRAARQPGEAIHELELAEQSLTSALTQLVGAVTVSYAPRFSGPREEYEHELERHRAYAALVPAALNELRPGANARLLVARHVESGKTVAALAAQAAARGDWEKALATLASATQHLQRALGSAGLDLPQGAAR